MRPLSEFKDSKNRSLSGQDVFVLSALKWKRGGTYLEIGAGPPLESNNTLLLSEEFGWNGVSIDNDPALVLEWDSRRPGDRLVVADARVIDYRALIGPSRIDYLQVDVDPPAVSLAALERVLDCGFCPSVITFEHDAYRGGAAERAASRNRLSGIGYHLAVADVLAGREMPYEDWWLAGQLTAGL